MRHAAVVVALLAFLAACGQKPGVHVALGPNGTPSGATGEGVAIVDPTTGEVIGTTGSTVPGADGTTPTGGTVGGATASGTAPGTTPTGTVAPGDPTAGGQTPRTGGDQTPAGSDPRNQRGGSRQPTQQGDSTGVTDDEIVVGFHAPITGAAPIPQSSFRKGLTQYWEWRGKVDGRKVRVIVEDDTYNPSRATTVCKKMIEEDEVFILGGAGGADQIAACARVAAQAGVPYISAGVDEGILRQLPNYFAFSMSYPQQAPLLMAWVRKNAMPSNKKFAILRDRTPSFNNVVNEVAAEAEKIGLEVLVRQIQNGPSDGQWLAANDIEVAFPIMSPSAWVQIANSPGGAIDQWVGVGLTMGLNTVANTACPSIDGAMFFSPFPGLNQADRLDPNFAETGGGDDIQWALWGSNKGLDMTFKAMNGVYTRESFINALQTKVISTGIYPDQRHSPSNHFGVNEVHMLRANCGRRQWETPDDGLFRKGF